ncbi:uncharacterized protein [Rutidosis leptorrhynchoides]|uniref:uncharacterized protein n=1 Tax=Rutidosis leptorrhynchoides TaxID=125765 RepID=UPI003A9A2BB3
MVLYGASHWEWKNCPVGWQGQYTRGDQKGPSVMLKAVASQDLWIWHAFFGMADYEKIDSTYTRFNNICSSLKALGTIYTDKQYVRKFLRALPSRWRPKVTAIDESKNAEKLTLDELIGNIKVHEVILDKDDEIDKAKREKNKSIALKAKNHEEYGVNDDDDDIINDEEQLAFIVHSFKKFYRRPGNHVRPPMEPKKTPFDSKKKFVRKCFGCGDPNHLISECPKRGNEKAFLGGAWDDEENDSQEEGKETCLMAIDNPNDDDEASQVGQTDNEVLSNTFEFNVDNFVKLCVLSNRVSNNNTSLKEENNLLRLEILQLKERISNSQECLTCDDLKHENLVLNKANKLLENRIKFSKYDRSSKVLENILNVQKTKNNKQGLGYKENTLKVQTSKHKPIVFVKPQEKPKVVEILKANMIDRVETNRKEFKSLVKNPLKRMINQNTRSNKTETKTHIKKNNNVKIVRRWVCLNGVIQNEVWIIDRGCTTHMTGNKEFFAKYTEHNGGDVIFGGDVKGKIVGKGNITNQKITLDNEYLTKFEPKAYEGVFLGYSLESKAYRVLNKYTSVIEESLDVTFNETPHPPKTKPSKDADVIGQDAMEIMPT